MSARSWFLPLLLLWTLLPQTIADVPVPQPPRGQGEHCVEPTDVMRVEHMTFLLHQRDATVLQGVRTRKHSLVGCVECHATQGDGGEFVPVNAPGQFCQSCHSFASVKLDCFECHAARPVGMSHTQ